MAQVNVSSEYSIFCIKAITDLVAADDDPVVVAGTETVLLPKGSSDNFIVQVQDANYQPVEFGASTLTMVYDPTTRTITITNAGSDAFTGKVIVECLM